MDSEAAGPVPGDSALWTHLQMWDRLSRRLALFRTRFAELGRARVAATETHAARLSLYREITAALSLSEQQGVVLTDAARGLMTQKVLGEVQRDVEALREMRNRWSSALVNGFHDLTLATRLQQQLLSAPAIVDERFLSENFTNVNSSGIFTGPGDAEAELRLFDDSGEEVGVFPSANAMQAFLDEFYLSPETATSPYYARLCARLPRSVFARALGCLTGEEGAALETDSDSHHHQTNTPSLSPGELMWFRLSQLPCKGLQVTRALLAHEASLLPAHVCAVLSQRTVRISHSLASLTSPIVSFETIAAPTPEVLPLPGTELLREIVELRGCAELLAPLPPLILTLGSVRAYRRFDSAEQLQRDEANLPAGDGGGEAKLHAANAQVVCAQMRADFVFQLAQPSGTCALLYFLLKTWTQQTLAAAETRFVANLKPSPNNFPNPTQASAPRSLLSGSRDGETGSAGSSTSLGRTPSGEAKPATSTQGGWFFSELLTSVVQSVSLPAVPATTIAPTSPRVPPAVLCYILQLVDPFLFARVHRTVKVIDRFSGPNLKSF
jgi:hypothetical protein